MDMICRTWTAEETRILLENIEFNDQGFISNISILDQLLKNRNSAGIRTKVRNLRKKGILPDLGYDDPLYPRRKSFSKYEDKIIIGALRNGTTPTEIGAALDRSMDSIQGRIKLLRSRGEVVPGLVRRFNETEVELLIQNVKFDEYGFVSNTDSLASLLKRSKQVIRGKISQLRKMGLIETLPDYSRSRISCNTRKAFRKGNELCFVFNTKKEPTPVPASVSQNKI